jgi:hypothetical protein
VAVFRRLLKSVATLQGGQWVLKWLSTKVGTCCVLVDGWIYRKTEWVENRPLWSSDKRWGTGTIAIELASYGRLCYWCYVLLWSYQILADYSIAKSILSSPKYGTVPYRNKAMFHHETKHPRDVVKIPFRHF